jgi:hypothetical protein
MVYCHESRNCKSSKKHGDAMSIPIIILISSMINCAILDSLIFKLLMSTAYRTGTYIAFHANGIREPTESDIKYYNLLKAWNIRDNNNFTFVDSHEKTSAIQSSSNRETIERHLKRRLLRSKNMILIIGQTTKEDTDWVPMEIRYAVDQCEIPIIAAYPGYNSIMAPAQLSQLWPQALSVRIRDGKARVIHIPFRKEPLIDAVSRFTHNNYPLGGGLGYYNESTYRSWGYL